MGQSAWGVCPVTQLKSMQFISKTTLCDVKNASLLSYYALLFIKKVKNLKSRIADKQSTVTNWSERASVASSSQLVFE